jgi:hypothetical protein
MPTGRNRGGFGPLLEVERSCKNRSGSSTTRVTLGAWAGILILLLMGGGAVGAPEILGVIKELLRLPW